MKKVGKRTLTIFMALTLGIFLAAPGKVNAGCVGATTTFEFGDTVTESCNFDGDMKRSDTGAAGHGLIVGATGITIGGNGYCLDGEVKACVGGETNDAGIYMNKTPDDDLKNVTIKNLEVKNFCHGIWMQKSGPGTLANTTGNTIECCEIHDNGDSTVGGSQTQGIKWNNVSESVITNCTVYNQGGDPTASGPPGAFGIYLCGGDDNEWCYNEIYDTDKAGIFLRCSPWRAHIHHNYVHHNPFAGIRCQCINDRDFMVEYNYCVNNIGEGSGEWLGGYGIFFGGADADPNTVRYNVCKSNRVGIAFERESWCGYVYENTACENTDYDIYVQDYADVTGDCNTCDTTYNYTDTSATSGCLYACGDQPDAGYSTSEPALGTIDFTDTSTPGNQSDPIDSWYWDFGDCSDPTTAQNPTHVFAKAGTYTVCLSVNDNKECSTACPGGGSTEGRRDTVCKSVVVQQSVPMADLVVIEKSEEWIDEEVGTYKVHYTVKNQGNASAGESTTCLFIDGANNGTESCPALDPGATHSGTFDGPFTCSDDSDTVDVCADSESVVTESHEDNNCKENEWSCSGLIFDIRNGAGKPGTTDNKVEVWLKNAVNVAGIQVDICAAGDYLSLPNADDVELTERTSGFTCEFEDDHPQAGCARVVLYSDEGSVIEPGEGPILILHYDVEPGVTGSCIDITSDNLLIADENDDPLSAAEDPGSFFFGIYGDIWPYEQGTVGDGEVNIFDVIRNIQIILETYTPNDCEFMAGDVPTGRGTPCEGPDGEINISDLIEMVAKILGRDNCIDLY